MPHEVVRGPSSAEREKWQAEEDLRTVTRFREVVSDKARLARVRRLALQQASTLASVGGTLRGHLLRRSKRARS